eukprot:359085-Prymnesium_polylepis.1
MDGFTELQCGRGQNDSATRPNVSRVQFVIVCGGAGAMVDLTMVQRDAGRCRYVLCLADARWPNIPEVD